MRAGEGLSVAKGPNNNNNNEIFVKTDEGWGGGGGGRTKSVQGAPKECPK